MKPSKEILRQKLQSLSVQEIAILFKVNIRTVYRWYEDYGISTKTDVRNTWQLSNRQMEIVLGSLLGDASLSRPVSKNQNSCYLENHCLEQADYLNFKAEELGDFVSNLTNSRKGKNSKGEDRVVRLLQTISHPVFTSLEREWYKRDSQGNHVFVKNKYRIKIVPNNLKLTPLMVAIWYFDDGWHSSKDRKVEFCTNGFTLEEAEFLSERLTSLNLKSYYKRDKTDGQPRVCIRSVSYVDFIDMVSAYAVDCVKYKIDMSNYTCPTRHVNTLPDIVEEIVSMWRDGKSYQEISIKTDIKRYLVGQILRRRGVVKNRANNSSGVVGVSRRGNLWYSYITGVGKELLNLGLWNTLEEAALARKKGEQLRKIGMLNAQAAVKIRE